MSFPRVVCFVFFSTQVQKYLAGDYKVSLPGDASHNFAFEIALSQAIILTLLLVCAFSPRVQVSRGVLVFLFAMTQSALHGKIYIIRCSCFGNRVFKTSEKGIRISGAQVSLWEKRHKKGIFCKMPLTVVCPVFQNGNLFICRFMSEAT